jgi:hypothetical protein
VIQVLYALAITGKDMNSYLCVMCVSFDPFSFYQLKLSVASSLPECCLNNRKGNREEGCDASDATVGPVGYSNLMV